MSDVIKFLTNGPFDNDVTNANPTVVVLNQGSTSHLSVMLDEIELVSPNFVTTIKLGYNELLGTGLRCNRVNLCCKLTNLPYKSVRYYRVFVYNRVSLYIGNFYQ